MIIVLKGTNDLQQVSVTYTLKYSLPELRMELAELGYRQGTDFDSYVIVNFIEQEIVLEIFNPVMKTDQRIKELLTEHLI